MQFTYELVYLGKLNRAPASNTIPEVEALTGKQYTYQVGATDPDGDPITFSLITAPVGMTIGAATGKITWTPTSSDVGTQNVAVLVEDGRGGSTV